MLNLVHNNMKNKNISLQVLCEAANSQIAQMSLASKEKCLKNGDIKSSVNNTTLMRPLLLQFMPINDETTLNMTHLKSVSFSDTSEPPVGASHVNHKHKFKNCNTFNFNANKCQYCDRVCSKPSVLEKHLRTHTNERPYPCLQCNQSFKTLSNLHKHKKTLSHLHVTNSSDNLSPRIIISSCKDINHSGDFNVKLTECANGTYSEAKLKNKLKKNILKKSLLNILDDKNISSNSLSMASHEQPALNNFDPPISLLAIPPIKQLEPAIVRLDPKTATSEMIRDHINELISKNEALVDSNLNQAVPIRTKSIKFNNSMLNNYKKIAPKFVRDEAYFAKNFIKNDNLNFQATGIESVLERQFSLPVSSSNYQSTYIRMTKSNTISDPMYVDSCLDIENKRQIFASRSKMNMTLDSNDNISKDDTKMLDCSGHYSITKINQAEVHKRSNFKISKTKNRGSLKIFSNHYPDDKSISEKFCKNILKEHIMKRSFSSEHSVNKSHNSVNKLDTKKNNQFILHSKSFDSSMPLKKRPLAKDINIGDKLVSNTNSDELVHGSIPQMLLTNIESLSTTDNVKSEYFYEDTLERSICALNKTSNSNKEYLFNKDLECSTDSDENVESKKGKFLQYLQFCINKTRTGMGSKQLYKTYRSIIKKYKQIMLKSIQNNEKYKYTLDRFCSTTIKMRLNQSKETNNNFVSSYTSKALAKESLMCEICNKMCISAMSLMMHRNVHYFDKRYKCKLGCHTSFQVQNSLLRHQRKYCHYRNCTGKKGENAYDPRPFKCTDCARAFRTSGHLMKHYNSKYHANCLLINSESLSSDRFGLYSMESSNNNAPQYDSNNNGKIILNVDNHTDASDKNCTSENVISFCIKSEKGAIVNDGRSSTKFDVIQIERDIGKTQSVSSLRRSFRRSSHIEIEEYNNSDVNCSNLDDDSGQVASADNHADSTNIERNEGNSRNRNKEIDINYCIIKKSYKEKLKQCNDGNLEDHFNNVEDKCFNSKNSCLLNSDLNDSPGDKLENSSNIQKKLPIKDLLNTCKICGFSPNGLKNLLVHIYSHVRIYVCKICDAAFSTRLLLDSHLPSHSYKQF